MVFKNHRVKSKGAEINFKAVAPDGTEYDIPVFTTRIDTIFGVTFLTIFGVTFLVIAPEHPLAKTLTTEENREKVFEYIKKAESEKEIDRLSAEKEKTGIFTGSYAMNPLNNKKVPILIGDYVVGTYGTGAVMGVPAHDQRDFIFAKKYKLPIKQVISPDGKEHELTEAYTEDGILINSGAFTTLKSGEAREKLTTHIEKNDLGKSVTRYHIRDWLISRQRYWGAPIPIIHCEKHGMVPVR